MSKPRMTIAEIARHFNVTRQAIQSQMATPGAPDRGPDGKFDPDEVFLFRRQQSELYPRMDSRNLRSELDRRRAELLQARSEMESSWHDPATAERELEESMAAASARNRREPELVSLRKRIAVAIGRAVDRADAMIEGHAVPVASVEVAIGQELVSTNNALLGLGDNMGEVLEGRDAEGIRVLLEGWACELIKANTGLAQCLVGPQPGQKAKR